MAGIKDILHFTAAGLDSVLLYRYGTDGKLTDFLTGSIANGDQYGNRGGVEFEMANTMPYNPAEPDTVTQGGERDDQTFNWAASPIIRFTAQFYAVHLHYDAVLNSVETWGEGSKQFVAGAPRDPQYPTTAIIMHQRATSLQASTKRQEMFAIMHLLSCQMIPVGPSDVTAKSESGRRYLITAAARDHTMWAETLTSAKHGTCAAPYLDGSGPFRMDIASYRGDGVETQFFLPRQLPANANTDNITVRVDTIVQTFGVDYVISTVTNSFTFQPGSVPGVGAVIDATYDWDEEC